MQEIGRAGRDGNAAMSILFWHGRHLRRCEESMKSYAKNKQGCLRQILLNKFGAAPSELKALHDCCCLCHAKCKCSGEGCEVAMPSYVQIEPPKKGRRERQVKPHQMEELNGLLEDYEKELKIKCSGYVFSSQFTTGFSEKLIKSTLKNSKYIFSLEDVLELVPVFKNKEHALDILHMMRDVFEDFEVDLTLEYASDDEESFSDTDFQYGGIYGDDTSGSSDDSSSFGSDGSDITGVFELQ